MPFLNRIADYINETLRAGCFDIGKLRPTVFHGIASVVPRSTNGSNEESKLELLPAIVTANGKINLITPDSRTAVEIYHKVNSNTYSYEKKSVGDEYFIKCVSELSIVVINNIKLTGKGCDLLEPVVVFGMPQRLSDSLKAELNVDKCLITPINSVMDQLQVFRQEFPTSSYFLNEQTAMFLIRYRVEMTFDRRCVNQCIKK